MIKLPPNIYGKYKKVAVKLKLAEVNSYAS